jgi:hypothetical protein
MSVSTTTRINGKLVNHGDTIISFRGEEFTFDYIRDGYIKTLERTNEFVSRVFVDVKEPESVTRP